jgi:hypothetical protein
VSPATAQHIIDVLRRASPTDRARQIRLLAGVVGFTLAETLLLIDDPEVLYRALREASTPSAPIR